MTLVDLSSETLSWFEAAIAGADLEARMSMLHVDEGRGVRTVLVDFPDGWRRDAVGTQPAGEEMVTLSGALHVAGKRAVPGHYLVITPRALRADTWTEDGTRAVVMFTGAGGGWVDGEELVTGSSTLTALEPGFVREPVEGLHGRVELRDDVAGAVLDQDVEVVWFESQAYAVVPAGEAVPAGANRALVRFLD
ncbi:hypothetical protein [Nocardioides daphniae]|uniref:Uncharacterized protein n=1 Tax=Nocardioides daphniae TaxID=402297 RepID=A0A4P7UEI1_9ACTN|nr:hypothetical protein [Nocardioides daphniae]QCC77349.1 hypothetical protein E2C04_09435 [Nocardioides daphniae]GGD25068.1 hypothetical protein GCM10007231_25420 [Nocardioides daphniae]